MNNVGMAASYLEEALRRIRWLSGLSTRGLRLLHQAVAGSRRAGVKGSVESGGS
ncbi:MAG: hypothetical protein QXS15_06690 [Candidatus Jordarchaeales archaeon]